MKTDGYFRLGAKIFLILFVLSSICVSPIYLLSQDKVERIDNLIQTYYDYGLFNGTVLVAQNGEVIFKKGFGQANMEWSIPNGPDTKFRLGSITKQFTATLILQLAEKGAIDLEKSLSEYLPYYREDTGKKITIHHLLTHSSGIPSYTSIPNFFDEVSRDPYSVEEFIKKYCSGDLEFEPGSKFKYNNSGYFILGAVIEQTAGKSYEEILYENIFKPLGMNSSGYDHHADIIPKRATGYETTLDSYRNSPYLDMSLPYAAGSLYSTVEDLYIWDQSLYTEKLLSKKTKELMFHPHIAAFGGSYGYGWSINKRKLPESKREINIISHGGGINGFNTLIERLVDQKHLIVLLNNTGGTNLGAMATSITRILFDEPYDLPKKSIARTLIGTIKAENVKNAIELYHKLKKEHSEEYNFNPQELNTLGYALLQEKRFNDAIEVFLLNTEIFPKNSNAYDSLAEAYMAKGDKKLAIINFAKSLELNPNNTNAVEQLSRLIKEE